MCFIFLYVVLIVKFRYVYSKHMLNFNEIMLKMKFAKKEDIKFVRLKKSNCKNLVFKLSLCDGELLFCESVIYKNLRFLYLISNFIDKKINECKVKFRGIEKLAFIEYFAKYVAQRFSKNHNFKVLRFIKTFDEKIQFQKKEFSLFKVVLSKYFVEMIFKNAQALFEIREVVVESKNTKSLKKYRKTILKAAQNYSICKFNKNLSQKLQSKKLLNLSNNDINTFIRQLYTSELLLKKSILYLKLFFE